jgi:SAM-dependent methyltransferase
VSVFSDIYRMNAWQGDESLSGPGSGSTATAHLAADIVAMVAELDIRSVLDVACGDGYWMPDLPGYTGIDVAPEAIELARARHPERRYLVGSAATVRLPRADLVIFRDALQHLSFRDGLAALSAIRESRPRYLLASTYIGSENIDIPTGACYSPNLEAPPFNFSPPVRLLFDGVSYHDADLIRDPAKHMGLWVIARTPRYVGETPTALRGATDKLEGAMG